MREVNIICTERSSNKVFEFPSQTLYIGETHFYITRTLRHNQALKLFLHNCQVSLQLQKALKDIPHDPNEYFSVGTVPNVLALEIRIPRVQVEGLGEGVVQLIYQRIEDLEELRARNKPIIYFENLVGDIFQEEKRKKHNSKKDLDFLSLCGEDHNKQENVNEDFLQNDNEMQDNYYIGDNPIKQIYDCKLEGDQMCQQRLTPMVSCFQDMQQDSNLHRDKGKKKHTNFMPNNNILEEGKVSDSVFSKSILPRSKERSIYSAIEIVSNWRDIYEQSKEDRVFRDLQQIAHDLGYSKKVLDYYFLELRTAEFFGFEFDQNLDKKFGLIRRFNQTEKQIFNKNQLSPAKKIPISNTLFYRIPSSTQRQTQQNARSINNPIDFNENEKFARSEIEEDYL